VPIEIGISPDNQLGGGPSHRWRACQATLRGVEHDRSGQPVPPPDRQRSTSADEREQGFENFQADGGHDVSAELKAHERALSSCFPSPLKVG